MMECFVFLRGKYLFRPLEHNEEITQDFFRKLYPSIITDITVSGIVCVCVCVCVCCVSTCIMMHACVCIHICLYVCVCVC